jgi:chromosome segregation ATPase
VSEARPRSLRRVGIAEERRPREDAERRAEVGEQAIAELKLMLERGRRRRASLEDRLRVQTDARGEAERRAAAVQATHDELAERLTGSLRRLAATDTAREDLEHELAQMRVEQRRGAEATTILKRQIDTLERELGSVRAELRQARREAREYRRSQEEAATSARLSERIVTSTEPRASAARQPRTFVARLPRASLAGEPRSPVGGQLPTVRGVPFETVLGSCLVVLGMLFAVLILTGAI